jgi:hypothetical protein
MKLRRWLELRTNPTDPQYHFLPLELRLVINVVLASINAYRHPESDHARHARADACRELDNYLCTQR